VALRITHARRFPHWLLLMAGAAAVASALASPQTQLQPQTQPQTQAPAAASAIPPARREFEVASITPDNSGPRTSNINPFVYMRGGRWTATDVTLVDIIIPAYQTRRIQMQGGPEWIDSKRFDIVAKADEDEGEIKAGQWPQMIQTLLEKRFKLVTHRETKEMPVYALVLGKTPPKFDPPKDGEKTNMVPGPGGHMDFQRMPLAGLVNTISNILRVPVVDETGMKGNYDFTLDPLKFATPGVRLGPNGYGDLIIMAVEEQLGFKLENRKEPLEITVIDHAELPTDN
jgi:uncharacterized protein (TIGR03435 family)